MMSRPTFRLNSWSVPPSSTSASQRHGVVALRQRIQELVQRDGLPLFVPLLEVAPLEHLRHVVARRQPDPVDARERAQPAAVEVDDRRLGIEQLEDLRLVGLGVGRDRLRRQRRTRLRSPGRITDQPGEVADQEHDPVPADPGSASSCAGARCARGAGRARSGSKPTFTVSGTRVVAARSSLARSSAARTMSTQPLVRYASCSSMVMAVPCYFEEASRRRTCVAARQASRVRTNRRPSIRHPPASTRAMDSG